MATLLFQALGLSEENGRESVMGLAVVFNSCELAQVPAANVFGRVARAVGGTAGDAIRAFESRKPQNKSMAAFMLAAVEDPRGGYEIKADWAKALSSAPADGS